MDINELTDLRCEGCGELVDVTADAVEPVLPLVCEPCLRQLANDAADRTLPVAA